jgi:Fe-S cluster assembly ATPase SufC
MHAVFDVKNLHVTVGGAEIIKGLTLHVPAGETHALMGPNGSGKSTLAYALSGRDNYEVTQGSATLDGEDLLALAPEERAAKGLFLSFQYPVEIPGLSARRSASRRCRWLCWSRALLFSMKRIPGSISMRCALSRKT